MLTRLRDIHAATSLEVKPTSPPTEGPEGIEQNWKCADAVGDLFSFTTCEANDKNALKVKAGMVCLVAGAPARGRARKDVSTSWKNFQDALVTLGAKPFKNR
jgi:hypothetical protein